MRKKFLTVLFTIVAALCLCFGLVACGEGLNAEGTYYLFEENEYNTNTYFILKGGQWTDNEGKSGDYEIDDRKIVFYSDLLGQRMALYSGTIKDGIITMQGDTGETIYAKEGAAHIHEYGDWTIQTASTCTKEGTEVLICKNCGKYISRPLALAPHSYGEWEETAPVTCTEAAQRKHTCTVCSHEETEQTASPLGHKYSVENKCVRYDECGTAWECTEGLDYELDLETDTYTVTGIGTASGDIAIPYGYQGKWVTSIGAEAFSDCEGLTSIKIPDSVTMIGAWAFSNCRRMTGITIPNSVTVIDVCAFYGCSGLTSLTIPESVTRIGDLAFDICNEIESISVAAGNTVYKSEQNCLIERNTNTLIKGCKNSKIPYGVTLIGYGAFGCCSGLVSIEIPDSVVEIGAAAFMYCAGLKEVTIGSGVTSIAPGKIDVFENEPGMLGLAYSVVGSFTGCSGLEHITVSDKNTVYKSEGDCLIERQTSKLIVGCKNSVIPADVVIIGGLAFDGIVLTNIVIPEGVIEIGEGAFIGCSGLTSVEIPDSVTSIGDWAFWYCYGLTDIQFQGTVKEWQAIEKGNWWDYTTGEYTVTCTDGTVDKKGNVTYFGN